MEKQHAKDFLKKYITVTGGPAAVDALDDENKGGKAKEFVKKYFTVVGGPEAIEAAAKQEHYLTMTLPKGSPETQISIKKQGEPVGTNIQYRVNNSDWKNWDFTSSESISANAGDVIQWKGNNPSGLSHDSENYIYFYIPNEVHLSGNVMSLIDEVNKTNVIPCSYCFYNLFNSAKIKTVTKDFLPATTLTDYCYKWMFYGRKSLENAPELPATTLAIGCYIGMFYGCTSLKNAPKLTATTLAERCYNSMFKKCSLLVDAPKLPATTLANSCYYNMFSGCTSLVNVPDLNATTLAERCCEEMFFGCTSLVKAPKLPATTLTNGCYSHMFKGCSNLNKVTCLATDISATDCTSFWLSDVASTGTFTKAAGVNWPTKASGIPKGWTVNKSEKPENPEPESKYLTMTLPEDSPATKIRIHRTNSNSNYNIQYRIDYGNWTDWAFTGSEFIYANAGDVIQWKGDNPNGLSKNYNSNYIYFDIPNEVHLSGNVMSLIDGVGEKNVIPCSYCFSNLFKNTKIKTVTKDFLPTTTLTEGCYYNMFYGCTSLVTAPELHATNLAESCYYNMFYGCSNLNKVTCLATDILATDCTTNWLSGVASTGIFVKASGFSGWRTGASGIPEGWTENEYVQPT